MRRCIEAAVWRVPWLLPLLLAGCAAAPRTGGGWSSRYPHSPALDAVVQMHADAAGDAEDRLLLTTWFSGGDPRAAMICSVRPDGHVSRYRYMHDAGAIQFAQGVDLVADQMAELRPMLSRLPPSQSPSLENLLVVSFRSATGWATRTYDRSALPAEVAELFAITGAPLDK
jgi:hypothetical protein